MAWLHDLLNFIFIPMICVVWILLCHQGQPRRFKIVRVTNALNESQYEVWFDHDNLYRNRTWRREQTFDTEQQARDFVARRNINKEVVAEGNLS